MLSLKPTFSLSSFTFIKRLFSSSSLSAMRVVSSAYLRLSVFLLAVLIPACYWSRLAGIFMMYSACKLNKQGDNIQPCHTRFPILNCPLFHVCCIWPACRFLRRQVRWVGIPISLRIFHNLLWYTVKGFSVINESEIDVFMEFFCFFYDPVDLGNLISGSFAFS